MVERNEPEISQILEESLAAVLSGKASVEDVIKQHPRYAAELRQELDAAVWLYSRREQVNPRPGFVSSSKNRVLTRIRQESSSHATKRALLGFIPIPTRPAYLLTASLIVFVLIFSGMGSLVTYAQSTIPGQQMYSVKLASEQVSYALAFNDLQRVSLRTGFAEKRLSEVETLIQQGQYDLAQETLAAFTGQVDEVVILLHNAEDSQPVEKMALASQINQNLSQQAANLEILVQNAPDEMRPALVEAMGVSTQGAASAVEALNKAKPPVTPAAITITQTQVATPVPPVENARPSKTLRPSKDQAVEPTALPTKTLKQRTSNTPKPTNENRPEKPEVPPEEDPKPPKDDKPTKADKKDK